MRKTKLVLMLLTLIFLTLSACGEDSEEPMLSIKYKDETLHYIEYGNLHNKTQEDIEKRLKEYMIGRRFEDLPTIPLDEDIILENENFDVESYEVYDYVLDQKSNIVSDFDTESYTVEKLEKKKSSFKLLDIIKTGSYDAYKVDDRNIHCLLIKCKIEKSDFVFAVLLLDH